MKLHSGSFAKFFQGLAIFHYFCCLFFFFNPARIQAQEIAKRPGVGLVLSGGGAYGIAHLGVIKVMEEAGLRPDYITGVSMGSIIGGMYSLGYAADSLHELLNEINWKLLISNIIPEYKVIFLEKAHFYHSIISLPISNKKFMFPSGLISGQQVESMLNFYAWPAADINDFSKLPIPFMCVATDIKTFKKIDLKTGYLADAIKASSSVPSIFTPMKIDTLLLMDGGLTRNFAASEVRDMGADIVIGSYTGFKGTNEIKLQSVSGIMKQIGLFRSLEDFEEQKKFVDVLIRPETNEFTKSGFEDVDLIFQNGYKAALPYKDYFRKLADSLNRIGRQKPLEDILKKQFYTFNKIEVTGNKIYSDFQILGVLDIKAEEKIDKYLLSDRIELLYGNAWFEKVKYRVVPRNDSLILFIDCIEKPQAMFYGSVHYDNSLLTGFIMETIVKNLLTQRSVIDLNSYIGQFYRIDLNYLQFIDRNQKFGLSANFYADNTLIPMLEIGGDKGKVIGRNFIPGMSVNRRLGLNNMISLSVNYENLNLIPRFDSDEPLKYLSYNYLSVTYDYKINTLDTKHFPDKGTIFNFSAGTSKLLSGAIRTDSSKVVFKGSNQDMFSFDRFFTFYGNLKYYFSPRNKLTFEIGGDVLLITDSDSVSAQNNFYLLGGIASLNNRSVPMAGFHSNEIPVKKMAGIRSGLDIELSENFHVNIMADIFAIQEVRRNNGFSLLTGFGLGVGYMSIIGPLRIGIMHGNYKQESDFRKIKGYISIGYKF